MPHVDVALNIDPFVSTDKRKKLGTVDAVVDNLKSTSKRIGKDAERDLPTPVRAERKDNRKK